jgi:hypothetical protein
MAQRMRVVLVLARGPVKAGASAQFDLALVEVLLEPEPLGAGDFPVLVGRAGLAAPVEECRQGGLLCGPGSSFVAARPWLPMG